MTAPYRVDTLGTEHDRQAFDCGVEPLNRYLKETARQDERKLVSRCFVACPAESMAIAGFYTLSSAELPTNALPEAITRKLPRYPSTPVGRVGRLAVDTRYRGQGLGSVLIADAVKRALKSDLAAFALVVDAKDEGAMAFYEHAGFFTLSSADRVLVLPLANLRSKINP